MIHYIQSFVDSPEAAEEGSDADSVWTLEVTFREAPAVYMHYGISVHANQSPQQLAQELRTFADALDTSTLSTQH